MKSFGIAARVAVAGFLACVLIATNSSAALTTWQDVRSTVATRGIATNGTVYVGTAVNGIWTSTDLVTWQHLSLPGGAGVSYNDMLWDGSRFIAAGDGLITSTDGSTWTVVLAPSSAEVWNAIAMMSGSYVVVGSDITHVLTSSDGTSWSSSTTRSLGVNARWDELIFGNDEFVATGVETDTGEGLILNGDGSTTWTLDPQPNVGEIQDVAWNGTSYVAVSSYDILEYTPPASTGGGGSGGGAKSSGGGGGSFDTLVLILLSGLALGRRPRR